MPLWEHQEAEYWAKEEQEGACHALATEKEQEARQNMAEMGRAASLQLEEDATKEPEGAEWCLVVKNKVDKIVAEYFVELELELKLVAEKQEVEPWASKEKDLRLLVDL